MTKNVNLKDQLCDLLTPAPLIHDSDDDETAAQVVEKYDDDEQEPQQSTSRLRLLNATLLDEDQKYRGKRISRKDLTKNDDDEEESEEDGGDRDEDDESDGGSDEEEIEEGDSDGDEEESDDEGEEMDASLNEGNSINSEVIENFSKMDFNDELDKGKSTRSQLLLWDSMLECRIKLQKVLQLTNQFPQFDVWPQFIKSADSDFKKAHKQGLKSVESLLNKLVTLQTTLLKKYPDTNKTVLGNENAKTDDDEEIPSDTEEEIEEDKEEHPPPSGRKRKLSFNEYPGFLSKRHKDFENFRNTTIQKWNDRTKLTTGKIHTKSFNAFDQTALKQIDQILSDKDRLRRRCQTKRSIYRVLGTNDQDNEEEQIDVEIFDDDDFYQQLLRELIEKRSVNVQDPIALGEQLLQIQKLRGKAKKKVDTKASKGRRIRYKVHPKLVNFMACHDKTTMAIEARTDLFNSLFGKRTYQVTQIVNQSEGVL